MTSQGAGEGGWNLGRRSLARRIRLTTAAIVMVAILGTAGIGTVVAAEGDGDVLVDGTPYAAGGFDHFK